MGCAKVAAKAAPRRSVGVDRVGGLADVACVDRRATPREPTTRPASAKARQWFTRVLPLSFVVSTGCERDDPEPRLVAAASVSPPAYDRCPVVRPLGSAGQIGFGELVETSGIVASRRHDGVLWAHNDSGNASILYAVASDGGALARFSLPEHVLATDWEDIALVPGRDERPDRIVLADIGDNARRRDRVRFVMLDEPDPTAGDALVANVEVLEATYPDGPHNAEAVLVDRRHGTLLVITKRKEGGAGLYRLDLERATPGQVQRLEAVGELPLESTLPASTVITGADATDDMIVVRGYTAVWLWPWEGDIDRLDTLLTTRAPCPALAGIEPQGEAITIVAKDRYVTTTEGKHPPLLTFELSRRAANP